MCERLQTKCNFSYFIMTKINLLIIDLGKKIDAKESFKPVNKCIGI